MRTLHGYLTKDCSMSAPSPLWSFSNLHDGMIIDQTGMRYKVNMANPGDCIPELGDQKLLIKVQNVKVQSTDYPNAIKAEDEQPRDSQFVALQVQVNTAGTFVESRTLTITLPNRLSLSVPIQSVPSQLLPWLDTLGQYQ